MSTGKIVRTVQRPVIYRNKECPQCFGVGYLFAGPTQKQAVILAGTAFLHFLQSTTQFGMVSWRYKACYYVERLRGGIAVQTLPLATGARRMAILIVLVGIIDVAAAFLTSRPQLWCALIPVLIPIFTPAAIFSHRVQSKRGPTPSP